MSRTAVAALTLFAALAALLTGSLDAQTKVTSSPFGKLPEGTPVTEYTLSDATLTVKIISFGAHVVSIDAPDRSGKKGDIVLGYKDMDGYLADAKTYMGSVVGRYGNRIAKGTFTLDGKVVHVDANEKGNTLHGGPLGFDRLNWTGAVVPNGVELTLVSRDGDMGFPGKLTAHVRYTLTGSKLRMDYTATTDKPTVVNLTQHSYFNLSGPGSGDVLGEYLQLRASHFNPVDKELIPTGEIAPVAGTPFDFRNGGITIGAHIHDDNAQLKIGGGFDHNWVIDNPGSLTQPVAIVTDPATGRVLTVYTTEPGVQFYSGNGLDGRFKSPDDKPYAKNGGLCLETQHFPDSPNEPKFPSTTLRPGQTYKTSTIFDFSVAK